MNNNISSKIELKPVSSKFTSFFNFFKRSTIYHSSPQSHIGHRYYYSLDFLLPPCTRLLNNWKPQKWIVISLIPLHFAREPHAHAPRLYVGLYRYRFSSFFDSSTITFLFTRFFVSDRVGSARNALETDSSRVLASRGKSACGGLFWTTHLTHGAKAIPTATVRHFAQAPKKQRPKYATSYFDSEKKRDLPETSNKKPTVRYVLRSATCDYVMNPKKVTLHRFSTSQQSVVRQQQQQQHSANPNRGAFHVVYLHL